MSDTPSHCPRCDDFGRVETADGLLVPCPEPIHHGQKSLNPWDGPTAGEVLEEYCLTRDAGEPPPISDDGDSSGKAQCLSVF